MSSSRWTVFAFLALPSRPVPADGYVLGIGVEADSAEGRALTIFGDFGLKITTEASLVETDFLDVVFNLATD